MHPKVVLVHFLRTQTLCTIGNPSFFFCKPCLLTTHCLNTQQFKDSDFYKDFMEPKSLNYGEVVVSGVSAEKDRSMFNFPTTHIH